MRFNIESGSRHGTMIGMLSGVKNSKLIGYLKSIESYLTWRSTISEDGSSYVAKICSIKISKSTNEDLISRTTNSNPISMTSCQPPSSFLANTSSFIRSSNALRMIVRPCGSWSQYPFRYLDIQVPGKGYFHLQQNWRRLKMEIFQSG